MRIVRRVLFVLFWVLYFPIGVAGIIVSIPLGVLIDGVRFIIYGADCYRDPLETIEIIIGAIWEFPDLIKDKEDRCD